MPRIFQAILLFVVNSESLEEIYQQNLKNEKKKTKNTLFVFWELEKKMLIHLYMYVHYVEYEDPSLS